MAAQMRRAINDVYLENLRDDDFIGVQTYSRMRFGPKAPLLPMTQMHYEFWSEALEATIRYAASITDETGTAVSESGLPIQPFRIANRDAIAVA